MEPILILSGLPPSATTDNLLSLLPKPPLSGGVIKAEVVCSSDLFPDKQLKTARNHSRGDEDDELRYGFIAFELNSDADAAQLLFDGYVLEGHRICSMRQTLGELELSMAQSMAAAVASVTSPTGSKNNGSSGCSAKKTVAAAAAMTAAILETNVTAASLVGGVGSADETASAGSGAEGKRSDSNKVKSQQQQQQLDQEQQQRALAATANAAQKVGLHGALRYPFAPMHLGWLQEYVSSLEPNSSEQLVAMCRVLECLMGSAVSTCDPFLEHAVVNFYTKFQPAAWGKVQTQQSASAGSPVGGLTFELSRQVFEVIGLIRRFPGATAKSRKMLLTLVERVLDDVARVTKQSPSMQHVRDIPEVIKNVHEAVARLRVLHLAQQTFLEAEREIFERRRRKKEAAAAAAAKELEGTGEKAAQQKKDDDASDGVSGYAAAAEDDNEAQVDISSLVPVPPTAFELDESLSHLTSWLRYLFFALSSTKPILVPASPPPPPGVQVVVPCSETCSCFERMQTSASAHLADVEKVKVIDSLLVSGFGATAEEEMSAFARELLVRYSIDFCARAVSQVQNGQFSITRFHVFEALRLARRSQSVATVAGIVEDWRSLDLIELALQHAVATCRDVSALAHVVDVLIPSSQVCLTRVRAARVSLLLQRHRQQQQEAAAAADGTSSGAHNHALNNNNQPFPASPASSDLFALQKHISDIFKALCNQQFLLCVHYVPYDAEVAAAQALEKHKKDLLSLAAAANNTANTSSSCSNDAAAAAAASMPEHRQEGEEASDGEQQQQKKKGDEGEVVDHQQDGVSAACASASASGPAPPPPSAASQPAPPKLATGSPKCANPTCGTVKGDLMKCSACKVTWYCSRGCQQADWKAHKAFCKATAAERALQQPPVNPTAAASQWLYERCDKATPGARICEIRPCI